MAYLGVGLTNFATLDRPKPVVRPLAHPAAPRPVATPITVRPIATPIAVRPGVVAPIFSTATAISPGTRTGVLSQLPAAALTTVFNQGTRTGVLLPLPPAVPIVGSGECIGCATSAASKPAQGAITSGWGTFMTSSASPTAVTPMPLIAEMEDVEPTKTESKKPLPIVAIAAVGIVAYLLLRKR